jgi:hypothetical protein
VLVLSRHLSGGAEGTGVLQRSLNTMKRNSIMRTAVTKVDGGNAFRDINTPASNLMLEICINAVTLRLKAGIVEPDETSIAKQRLSKHVPAEMKAHATIEQQSYAIRF